MDLFDLREWPGFAQAGGNPHETALTDQVTIDSRRLQGQGSLFVALPGEKTDGHLFVPQAASKGAKFALVNREYNREPEGITLLRVPDPLKALQEIAKAYRTLLPTKIIAITGSYGKTMAKDLLKRLLESQFLTAASPESFNSQIGVPLSLLTLSKEHEVGIIEAAISKPEEMHSLAEMIKPDVCVLTHVGQKHLDTLGTVSNMLKEYFTLIQKNEWAMLPDLPELSPYIKGLPRTHFWNRPEQGMPHATHISEGYGLSIPYRIDFPDSSPYQNNITSGFYYYLDLINMCVKTAWKWGVSKNEICKTLDSYKLEPSRTEIWKSPTGLTLVNDTYSEDPGSVEKAFRFLEHTTGKGRKIFLFGGLKGNPSPSDYRHVGNIIANAHVDTLFLSGDAQMDPVAEALSQASPSTSILKTASHSEALDIIRSTLHSDDIVLIKGKKKEPLETVMEIFHEAPCTNLSIINLAAIEENIKAIRKVLRLDTRIMVMVKALGYGTDDFRMAKFLKTCGIDILGVSSVEEGVALKRGGVEQAIFVLQAADYEIPKVVKWHLEVGVSTLSGIKCLREEAQKAGKQIKVHLHIDTGMRRFGCMPEDTLQLALDIKSSSSLILEGIMTHFAASDDPKEDPFTLKQARKLETAITQLKEHSIEIPFSHASNSAAILRHSFPQFNMVRPGLAIYGLYPSPSSKIGSSLRPAISLVSRIAGINTCKKGDTVSYGRTYKIEKDEQKIAVLPIGYFDGLHRNYSGKGDVLIRGKKAPMVGKICMDFMMVDVTEIEGAAEGDPVLIFGEDDYGDFISAEDVAGKGDSIAHELITCLGPRIQRVFIYEESHKPRVII